MCRTLAFAILAAVAGALLGCSSSPKVAAWQNPLDVCEKTLPTDPKNISYVLSRMEYAKTAINMGSYSRAKVRLEEAFAQFDVAQSNLAAGLGTERNKYYKGETYERAMVCFYLGYVTYVSGDYNKARIYFARAIVEDRKAVVNKDTPEIYGDDFGLAYFWLGKAYQKLGDEDNARIAFTKAGRPSPRNAAAAELTADKTKASDSQKLSRDGEVWCMKTFGDAKKSDLFIAKLTDLGAAAPQAAPAGQVPDDFLTCACQQNANLVLTIELGNPPYKYLSGMQNETTLYGRPIVYPCQVIVTIDGQVAGPALQVLDMWHQSATQDRIIEKEGAQFGKALAKTALEAFSGSNSNWDVSGDARYWASLRDKDFIFASRVTPGPHTVVLQMYDINGQLLPRWTHTYYGLAVGASGETCVLLEPTYNGDNQLPAELAAKAVKAGAKNIEP